MVLVLLLGPELRFPPYPAGIRTGNTQCDSKRSFGFIGPLSAGRGPEKGALPRMSPANARAAIAIAVTDVVGVLIMVGAFLGSSGEMPKFYAKPKGIRKPSERRPRDSNNRLSHSRDSTLDYLPDFACLATSMSRYFHGCSQDACFL